MTSPYTVAVLADVHGNIAALEAVLTDLATRDHDAVVVAGNLAQLGPRPAEALARVRGLAAPTIFGNADRAVVDEPGREGPRWVRDRIGAAGVTYLAGLPFSYRITPPGGRAIDDDLLIVHATPTDVNAVLVTESRHGIPAPVTPEAQAAALLGDVRAGLIVYGHIHYFSAATIRGRRVASIGSVGFPADEDHRAAYALVSWDGATWRVTPRRAAYDHLAVAAEARASGAPFGERAARMLETARMVRA